MLLRPSSLTIFAICLGLLGAPGLPRAARAQQPTPEQLQQLARQSPDLIRQRLLQSGLSATDVRSRLRAAGYPDNLLDNYLEGGMLPLEASPGELSAFQALGLAPPTEQEGALTLDTGLVRRRDTVHSNVFGVDVFQRASTQFLPLLSGPVPPDYRLGPGDQLVLILTGDVQKAYSLPVTRQGFILIPQVGQVFVNNLTLDQLRELLYERLRRVYSRISTGPDGRVGFDVSVANVRTNQIFVIGEVIQPGTYQLSSLATALTALYAAGGVTDRANLRRVDVLRLGKPVATLDLYDYLLHGDARADIRLETGDVLLVRLYDSRIQLTGAVVRPMIYEMKEGESLADLIEVAGGLRPNAEGRRITIHRMLPPGARGPGAVARAAIDVALTTADPGPVAQRGSSTGTAVDFPPPGSQAPTPRLVIPAVGLMDGDSVVVDSLPPLERSLFVTIDGMVNKTGRFPWHEGMTLRELVLLARGPAIGASLQEAEIARLPADRSTGALAVTLRVPLDSSYLLERDSSGRYAGPPGVAAPAGGTPEVPLQPFDNVLILKQPEFDFQRTVVLSGEVRYPGIYSLRAKDERLADVIERAGGLSRQAYPEGIRFVRPAREAGRINIDLPRALRDRKSRDNVILQPGDSIDIPEFQASVRVTGAVNSPGSVLWRKGADLEYYLSAAGGLAADADKGRASVRFANGETRTSRRRLFSKGIPEPGPGSEILVPAKPPGNPTDKVALMIGIAQVLSSLVALAVVLTQ